MSLPADRGAVARLVLFIDALVVVASMALAFALHATLRHFLPQLKATAPFEHCALIVAISIPLWLFLIALFDLHRIAELGQGPLRILKDLVKLHLLGLAALALVLFLTQAHINRSIVALFTSSTLTLLYLERLLLLQWRRYQHQRGSGQDRLLLVGDPTDTLRAFVSSLGETGPFAPRLVGRLSDTPGAADEQGSSTHLGSVSRLAELLHDEAIDRVLFFPPFHRPEEARPLMDACDQVGVPSAVAIELVPFSAPARIVTWLGQPFLAFEPTPKRPASLAVKHAADLLFGALLLLLAAPVLLAIALAIRLLDGSPVLFRQQRVGHYGRRFGMLKFRTMVPEAEAQQPALKEASPQDGPTFKLTADPRVTSLGRFLRRTSLDELPQLINVLRGEMSLVGPRPLPIGEQQQIRGWYRRRLTMKPGLTGLWQVSGRSQLGFDEWMRMDLKYVDEWSLALDLKLLLLTLPAVLRGRGAY
ncbi:MAG: exopolysaccharide biosynthesis polyprenyl glycosylphosphotransferase [Deltaproteobacteria bacterium]|nr:exopolysaccharide biosynthesis polyprenyl glycosylphosphotransferase [Deltaproteobacteria bacterium]